VVPTRVCREAYTRASLRVYLRVVNLRYISGCVNLRYTSGWCISQGIPQGGVYPRVYLRWVENWVYLRWVENWVYLRVVYILGVLQGGVYPRCTSGCITVVCTSGCITVVYLRVVYLRVVGTSGWYTSVFGKEKEACCAECSSVFGREGGLLRRVLSSFSRFTVGE